MGRLTVARNIFVGIWKNRTFSEAERQAVTPLRPYCSRHQSRTIAGKGAVAFGLKKSLNIF